MKTLYFIRHAKAQQHGYEDDFNRDLTKRGEEDIARVAQELANELANKLANNLANSAATAPRIISSSAKRALRTAQILAAGLGFKGQIEALDELYNAGARELLELVLNRLDAASPASGSAFIIGHNPTMHEVCELVSGRELLGFPTSSVFGVEGGRDELLSGRARVILEKLR